MRWRRCRPVMLGFALLAVSQAYAEEDFADRLEKAQEAARGNAASPEGSKWKRDSSSATSRLMVLVVNRCLPEPSGDVPTPFSVYLRLSKAGVAREIITDLDPSLERCMTTVGRELPFPEAPRDDYWVQVNLAVPR